MNLQEYIIHKFSTWKPPAPAVQNRTSRDVTLTFSAGPFAFLKEELLYRVEKKEKIPAWVVVYSGGKTTKTIDNLAPCHPHRFRLRVTIKAAAVIDLAERLIKHHGDERAARSLLNGPDGPEDQNHKDENNLNEDKTKLLSHTIDCEKLLLPNVFERGDARSSKVLLKRKQWLESSWSDETWTSTDSEGTSAACFCMAVRCGYLKQVQQMAQERPLLVSIINYSNGYTPLATAVRAGQVNMVKYLLSADAEIEQRSSTGQTPLHLAILSGHIAVAELLLDEGADFQARDLNQLGVEHYAVDSCKLEVVKFVFDRGGDVRVRDSNGWTPLFRAVCQGATTAVIEELVRRGSDVRVADRARLPLAAAARLLTDRQGRRRESVLRLVDAHYQHEKVVASFTRLTKKISSVNTLFKH